MEFVTNIDPQAFDDFVRNHPTMSHFLQSPQWAEVSTSRGSVPHFVGFTDQGKLVAAAMLLQKKLPLGYSHFYAPRGYILDYHNRELIRNFTNHIAAYCRSQKAIYFKVDPDIRLHHINENAEPIADAPNNYELVDFLKGLGFKHKGFYRNFEGSQPRFTFRIDLQRNISEILGKFSTTTKQRIKKAKEFEVEVTIGGREQLHDFSELVVMTERRKQMFQHVTAYYYTFYDIFTKTDDVKLFMGKVYPGRIVEGLKQKEQKLQDEFNKIETELTVKTSNTLSKRKKELEKSLPKVKEDIAIYSRLQEEYPEGTYATAQMIVYYGDKAWVLYVGNNKDLGGTYANYLVYEEHIKYAHERGVKVYDQFGTVGDLSQNNPLLGLHEFKRKFGGDYYEFIGEFDLITNGFMYFIFNRLTPFYRKIVRTLLQRKS